MEWSVDVTAEFGEWWKGLDQSAQNAVAATIGLLRVRGPDLPFPYSSDVRGSRHGALRELRIQHRGRPLRVLYAFDPHRVAILLLGEDKRGSKRWYRKTVPRAERLFDNHLEDLKGGA